MSDIGFSVYSGSGALRYGEATYAATEKLDRLLDRKEGESLSESRFISALKAIVKSHPDFLDGHAHLGYALYEAGEPADGLKSCLHAVLLGESAIPDDFTGALEDNSLSNRPFFRAMHGAVLCHLDLGEKKQAISMMKKMLKWSPNDSYGMRLIIGSEYLSLGMDREALPYLTRNAGHFPPYEYDLALYYWRACDFTRAATALRRAFIGNVYIAEMLLGNSSPRELSMFHMSSNGRPDTAYEYVGRCGDMWKTNGEAIPFMKWLFNHPEVMAERSAAFECLEDLATEKGFDERKSLRLRYEEFVAQIDDVASERMTEELTNPFTGGVMMPWQADRN